MFFRDVLKTIGSLVSAMADYLVLRVPATRRFLAKSDDFHFLVHPRTDEFIAKDEYGLNDIYRPYPAFRYLFSILPERYAKAFIYWYAYNVVPISLSRITVEHNGRTIRGRLTTTVRTPGLLLGKATRKSTAPHLLDLYQLAAAHNAGRVGLGALLPSLTHYGESLRKGEPDGPPLSTGHAYTAYMITEYLQYLVTKREQDRAVPRVAIVGAVGSTGSATVRVLMRRQMRRMHLVLLDLPGKENKLEELRKEASWRFSRVETATDHDALLECDYVVVVTNGQNAKIRPQHIKPGAVIIDDSQPRNTDTSLIREADCFVVDVLARVKGLDCHFDFGFQTEDTNVTFTCLAETAIAAILGMQGDLAVGFVDDEVAARTVEMAHEAEQRGIAGPLPFFSFGREMRPEEVGALLQPRVRLSRPAAE